VGRCADSRQFVRIFVWSYEEVSSIILNTCLLIHVQVEFYTVEEKAVWSSDTVVSDHHTM
jgi:hypothetical protein